MDMLSRNLAGIINSLAFVAVAFLVVWMGVRPMIRSVTGNGVAAIGDTVAESAGLELPDFAPAAGAGAGGALMDGFGSDFGFDSTEDLLSLGDDDGNFNRRVKEGPERKLARMVEINEERAAKILQKMGGRQRRIIKRPGNRPFSCRPFACNDDPVRIAVARTRKWHEDF